MAKPSHRDLSDNNNMLSLTRAANHAILYKSIFTKIHPALCSTVKHNFHTTPAIRKEQKQELPHLPVPPLKETIEKYLKSLIPLLKPDEFECTKKIAEDFAKPGGCGEHLQKLLNERAKKHENWLEEWWINTAYLGYRLPVVVHSSPGLVFPFQKFCNNNALLTYTAKLIITAMLYKDQIDNNKIPVEKQGKDPLDMGQYKKFFGTCRIPKPNVDGLEFNPKSCHIIVACNNNFFKLCVDKNHSLDHIMCQLHTIQERSILKADAVGILTSDTRDNWAKAYKLLIKDQTNCESVQEIQKSLFLVCLDQPLPACGSVNRVTQAGGHTIHGGGTRANGGNRWFDKTVQFIVSKDGIVGMTYEHSPSEGQPIAVMTDFLVNNLSKPFKGCESGPCAEKLEFNINNSLKDMICQAGRRLDCLIDDLDLHCNIFDKYGKNFIKTQKLSPDSYLQMAMQFSYYRMHKKPAAHYESAATRKYIGGRTETIRSCSVESVKFAKAMLDSKCTDAERRKLLQDAVNGHKKYTMDAINGLAIDRHFLGLKLIAKENNIQLPEIFKDKAFSKSIHFNITSSQVATKCEGFMCYGAVVSDGYGICYNPRNDNIYYGISCFNDHACTSATKMVKIFEQSLMDMHDVLSKTQQAKL